MLEHDRATGGLSGASWTTAAPFDTTFLSVLALPVLLDNVASVPGGAVNFDWVGGTDGNGDWNLAADWVQNSVPGAGQVANFGTGDDPYTVTGDATIGEIAVNGDLVTLDGIITQNLNGQNFPFLDLTNDGQLTIDANSFLTGGAINGDSGTLLDVQGGLIAGGGIVDTVIVEGLSGQAIISSLLQVNQLYVQDGASFTGNVDLTNGGNITLDTSSSFGGGTVTMLGSGLIYAAAAPGQISGSIGIGDAIILTESGSVLNLAADPGVTLAIGGQISGEGSVLISGGTVEFTTANSYSGFTGVQYGTLQVDNAGLIPTNLVFLAGGAAYVNELVSSNGTLIPTNYHDTIVASGASDTVAAYGGGVLVFAGPASALNFVGGAQESTVIGGSGKLIAIGGNGDLIFGGTSGADQLYTGDGNSTLVGGNGATLTADGSGATALVAGGGNVVFDASHDTGNVTLFGAAGDSTSIIGGAGTVNAIVNNSDATIYGGTGIINVFTGSGALSLDYVVGFGGGATYVDGFDVSRDQINLVGFANGTAQAVLAAETITGGNTILALPDNTHIELFGVTDLTIHNFV
jgi:hypothetical protein